jgi:outer membrane protein assembly factor BamA
MRCACVAWLLAAAVPAAAFADDAAPAASVPAWPDDATLEAQGARIGSVTVRDLPIFDPSIPGEKKAIYRVADRLHVDTRDSAIQAQLLFRPGDLYSRRLLDETERNLRRLRYIREPEIRIVGYHDGVVDLEVAVHEVWTTNPGLSYGRSGGTDKTGISIEELNLFGFGKHLAFDYSDDVDRSSYSVHWHDPNLFGSRWRNDVILRDSDDGSGQWLAVERPFYALDAHWSAGVTLARDETVEHVYRLGEDVAGYGQRLEFGELRYGWSAGLRDGWTRRFTAGFRRDHADFEFDPDETAPVALPAARHLDYPWLRLEVIEDDFDTTRNRDQIARTEDFEFGTRFMLELGWASGTFGADRDAALLRAEASRGFRLGDDHALFLDAGLSGRHESGDFRDALVTAGLRYYVPDGPKRTFYASLTAEAGHRLDADHERLLGGDTGLRGYPLRYQAGQGRALLTLEQRFYTKYSLWRLADIGGAIFFDMGKVWGGSAFGPNANQGLLKNAGFGLRFGSTKTGLGNVLHVDVAFPLDGDRSISGTQILVQTKRSF